MNHLVYGLLISGLCYLLACRIDKMVRGVTIPHVFWQHAILGVCAFGSLLLNFTSYEVWSAPALAFGVFVFFMFSLKRWRSVAPEGTSVEMKELGQKDLRHVVGGSKTP